MLRFFRSKKTVKTGKLQYVFLGLFFLVMDFNIKSNLSLYSLYSAEVCNEFAGPISASLRLGKATPFEKMLQW